MKRKFIIGTCLLTATSLLLRAVGIFFHAKLAYIMGAEGMGVFTQVMAIYRFGVTVAVSGIGLACAKIVAEEQAQNYDKGVRKAVGVSLMHGAVFGTFAAGILFFFAPCICRWILQNETAENAVRLLAVSLPFVAMSSGLHGYFSTSDHVGKSAIIQVTEQVLHVFLCLFVLFRYPYVGSACEIVAGTCAVSECISFLLLFLLYRTDVGVCRNKQKGKKITKRVLSVSLPVAVSAYVRSGLSSLEYAFIPNFLSKSPMGKKDAFASYGAVHGMVLPLIYFPSAALQAFSTLLIPKLTVCLQKGQCDRIRNLVERSLQAAMVFSVGVSCFLFFFAEEIAMAVYRTEETANYIRILAPLTVAMYADSVVDGALKGLNQQVYSMGYNIMDAALALVLMPILLPKYGTAGYIMIIYVTELANSFFSIRRLFFVSDFRFRPVRWAVIPCFAATACCMVFQTVPWGAVASVCTFSVFAFLFYGKKREIA